MKEQIDFGNIAVVLIDMQESFLKYHNQEVIERKINNQKRVLNFCAQRNYPLAILEWVNHENTIWELKKYTGRFKRHKPFFKSQRNGFSNPLLLYQLRNWGADSLLLMGVETSQCVRKTGIGALESGFKILTAGDLVDDQEMSEKYSFCADWIKENSNYYSENSESLLKMLKKNNLKNSFL